MTDIELIQHTIKMTLTELGYKPKSVKGYLSQNEAIRLSKPVRIGRARLTSMIQRGEVRVKDKADCEKRNSRIRIFAEDIYKLLND